MKLFRALALSGTILAWMLALLGSWTRINSAGMTCPDWPLCRGAVVPVLQGGVVLEWTHRLLALLLTLLVAAIVIDGWRLRKRIPGLVGLLGALVAALAFGLAVVFRQGMLFLIGIGAAYRLFTKDSAPAADWPREDQTCLLQYSMLLIALAVVVANAPLKQ